MPNTRQSATCAIRNAFHLGDAISKLFTPPVAHFSSKAHATNDPRQEAVDHNPKPSLVRYEYAHRDGKPRYRIRHIATESNGQVAFKKKVQRVSSRVPPPKAEQDDARALTEYPKVRKPPPSQGSKHSILREGEYVPQTVGTLRGERNEFAWMDKVDKVTFGKMSPMAK